GLAGKDPHGELLAGEIGTGELIGIGRFGLILIDRRGGGLVATTLQLLDRGFAGVVVVLARGVVISGHLRSVPGLVGVVRPGCWGSSAPGGPLGPCTSGPSVNAECGGIIAARPPVHNICVSTRSSHAAPAGRGVSGGYPRPRWTGAVTTDGAPPRAEPRPRPSGAR